MPTKRWRAMYGGHDFELVNFWAWTLSHSWQALNIDGQEAIRRQSNPLFDVQDHLEAVIDEPEGPCRVQGIVAAKGLRVAGQCLVNGVPVGGDYGLAYICAKGARANQGGSGGLLW